MLRFLSICNIVGGLFTFIAIFIQVAATPSANAYSFVILLCSFFVLAFCFSTFSIASQVSRTQTSLQTLDQPEQIPAKKPAIAGFTAFCGVITFLSGIFLLYMMVRAYLRLYNFIAFIEIYWYYYITPVLYLALAASMIIYSATILARTTAKKASPD